MTQADPRFTLAAAPGRVRVLFEGHELADSAGALVLNEAGRDAVYYFPRGDVQMSVLRANDHRTMSPAYGTATWFTISRDAKLVEDVAWSYEKPHGEADLFAGYLAFDPQHVEFEADAAPAPVRHVPSMNPPYAD